MLAHDILNNIVGIFIVFFKSVTQENPLTHNKLRGFRTGRADRIRTCGLFVPNEARYQTALQLVVCWLLSLTRSAGRVKRFSVFLSRLFLDGRVNLGEFFPG